MPVDLPRVVVAGDFLHDSEDLLKRYKLTIDHFYAVKSRRLKTFIDLRMAAECLLKMQVPHHALRRSLSCSCDPTAKAALPAATRNMPARMQASPPAYHQERKYHG